MKKPIKRANNLAEGSSSSYSFEFAPQDGSELIDDPNHPTKCLFKDFHNHIQNINTELNSELKFNIPSVRRRATEALFLLSAMFYLAGCKSYPFKSLDDVMEPTPKEKTNKTAIDEPIILTVTQEPSQTPTFSPTPTPVPTSTPTPTFTETPTRIPTSEDYWVRGYSLGITFSPEGWCTSLFVEEAEISEFYVDGGEIVLEIEMLIYERNMKEEVRSKSLQFMKYDNNTRSFSQPEFITAENFNELNSLLDNIGPKTRYQVKLTAEGCSDFSDDIIVNYVSGYVDLDLRIVQLVQYEKNW